MGRKVTCGLVSSLMFVLAVSVVCLWSNWTVSGASTITVPDDYSTIQGAINHAVDGDTILVKAGIYYEHIVVNKTVSLFGEDVDTTIIDGNNTGHVVNVVSENVTVTGFTIQRSGNTHWPALEAGICLNHSAGCVISGNRLIDNGFCGISLLYSDRNTVSGNAIARSSWGGIHLLTSSYNAIFSNTVDSVYGGVNGHASSHYNNFTDNVITNSTHGMFYYDADHNYIRGNTISTIAAAGIWLQDQVDHNVVTENYLVNNTVGVRVQGPNRNNTVSKNVISHAEYGVQIQSYAIYTRITENTIVDSRASNDSWNAGIRLDSGWYAEIDRNTIAGNNYGILLYASSHHISVYLNNITDNEFGLRVANGGSSYLNASDNRVLHNRGYGIGLTGFVSGSHYATITRNLIANNSDGLVLGQYSNYHTITHNNISHNGFGFYIEYSTQNTIWHNTITGNAQPVYVSNDSVNAWDGGYPTGGNYWSDYIDVDLHKGQHQNETGRDDVWDHPYGIDESNQDRYPLTKPYSEPTGDVDGDQDVDIFDIVRMASIYSVESPDPRYSRLCDLDLDADIDIFDIVIAAEYYGESW